MTISAFNWVDGQWINSGVRLESRCPSTGELLGTYADGSVREAELAVAAAKRAFEETDWRRDRLLRANVLLELAEIYEAHREELVEILALENGKLAKHAAFEVDMVPDKLRFYASVARTDYGRSLEVRPGVFSMVLRQARGVVGVIAPWNSPVVLTIRSLAPALAVGATAVVKVPGQSALINYTTFRLWSQATKLPRGVINGITGAHRAANTYLVESADVACISYTGSTAVGKSLSEAGAKTNTKFGHELGGKTPLIVFDDADLDAVADGVTRAITTFNGEFCVTGGRILAQRGIADELRAALKARFEALQPGHSLDPASDIGPLIDKANVARVDALVQTAITAGAQVIVRGGAATESELADGAFYHPTLLEASSDDLEIVQEEVFGPVAVFQIFDSEAEAVQHANATVYGLAASIWTTDGARSLRVAREIDAGTVWINDWGHIYDECEEGGFKDSGLGRMNGLAVLEDFVEYKHITLNAGMVGR
ncbi:aldehyde dehydrogenase family protein [Mycobacteroides abscessus]|uniref:aldehyde dehydrogenase family protein n=1 Tax=Mycobacteroides abscessus TaxID=36809 RepID=UPI002106A695|nr:aldehyde dehydrogenase family protein [Mycobacteroides abscessus]